MTTTSTVMMPSSFELEMSTDGGTTWAEVLQVKSFNLGNIEADEIDVTNFNSADDFREFKNGLKQASDGSFTVNYLIANAQHKLLRDHVGDADPYKFRATYTAADGDEEIETFDALIKAGNKPAEIGGVLEMTVGFKMTGAPTYTGD